MVAEAVDAIATSAKMTAPKRRSFERMMDESRDDRSIWVSVFYEFNMNANAVGDEISSENQFSQAIKAWPAFRRKLCHVNGS